MGINQNLKKYRELNRLTQQDVSEKLNISRQSVSKWENGKSYPDLDNLLLLSQLYDVSVDDILSETSPKTHIIKQQKNNKSSVLLFFSIISFFIMPIGGIIGIIIFKKNNKNKKYHNLIKILCITCITFSFFMVCLILFFSLFFHV